MQVSWLNGAGEEPSLLVDSVAKAVLSVIYGMGRDHGPSAASPSIKHLHRDRPDTESPLSRFTVGAYEAQSPFD